MGSWRANFPAGEQSGAALVNLTQLATAAGVFILNPPAPVTCPNPLATFASSFILNVGGSEAMMMGRSQFFTCDGVIEGRVELTRQ